MENKIFNLEGEVQRLVELQGQADGELREEFDDRMKNLEAKLEKYKEPVIKNTLSRAVYDDMKKIYNSKVVPFIDRIKSGEKTLADHIFSSSILGYGYSVGLGLLPDVYANLTGIYDGFALTKFNIKYLGPLFMGVVAYFSFEDKNSKFEFKNVRKTLLYTSFFTSIGLAVSTGIGGIFGGIKALNYGSMFVSYIAGVIKGNK